MKEKTINILRIVTNIILSLLLVVTFWYIITYQEDVQEAINGKEPARLMQIYEERTNTKCLCANSEFGEVVYIPFNKK